MKDNDTQIYVADEQFKKIIIIKDEENLEKAKKIIANEELLEENKKELKSHNNRINKIKRNEKIKDVMNLVVYPALILKIINDFAIKKNKIGNLITNFAVFCIYDTSRNIAFGSKSDNEKDLTESCNMVDSISEENVFLEEDILYLKKECEYEEVSKIDNQKRIEKVRARK